MTNSNHSNELDKIRLYENIGSSNHEEKESNETSLSVDGAGGKADDAFGVGVGDKQELSQPLLNSADDVAYSVAVFSSDSNDSYQSFQLR